jgi:hypothetical protein
VVENQKVNFEGCHKNEDRDDDEARYTGSPVCDVFTLEDRVSAPE